MNDFSERDNIRRSATMVDKNTIKAPIKATLSMRPPKAAIVDCNYCIRLTNCACIFCNPLTPMTYRLSVLQDPTGPSGR